VRPTISASTAFIDLPFGRGKHFGQKRFRGLDALIGGWQVATIGDWRSGNWLESRQASICSATLLSAPISAWR